MIVSIYNFSVYISENGTANRKYDCKIIYLYKVFSKKRWEYNLHNIIKDIIKS